MTLPHRLSDAALHEITTLLYERRKIGAIKVYREAAGVGLKEAKEAIDAFEAELAREFPDKFAKRGGCSITAAAILLAAGLWALTAI